MRTEVGALLIFLFIIRFICTLEPVTDKTIQEVLNLDTGQCHHVGSRALFDSNFIIPVDLDPYNEKCISERAWALIV